MMFRLLAPALVILTALAGCGSAEDRSAAYVERAREYLAEEDYVKARLDLRNAVKIDPDNVEARMLLVDIAEQNRNFRQMYEQLARIIAIDPDNVEAHVRLGVILLSASQQDPQLVEQVREHVSTALALAPDNADARVLEASLMRRDGDREAALAQVRDVLAEHPDNVPGVSLLFSLYLPDDPEAALATLDEGIRNKPDSPALHLLKVGLLQNLERWEAVERALQELRERFPGEKSVDYRLTAFYVQRGRLDEAQAVLERMLGDYPDDTTVKLEYAEFLANHRDAATAETTLRRFADDNPAVSEFQFALATLYESVDRRDDAERAYRAVIDAAASSDDRIKARNDLAKLYLREGRLDEARPLIAAVLEESPSDPEALVLRAGLAMEDGRLDDAIADLRTARRNDPQSVRALTLLAQAHLQAGDVNLAEERLRDLLAAHPDNVFGRDRLATILVSRGELDEARRVIEQANARGAPVTTTSIRMLAEILTRQQEYERARSIADTLLDDETTQSLGRVLRARSFQAERRFDDALAEYQAGLETQGPTPELLSGWVTTLAMLDRAEEALPVLERYRESTPESFEVYTLLGQVHARLAHWDEARTALERSLELRDDVWPTYRDLVAVHMRTGNSDAAVAVLESGLAVAPDNPQLRLLLAEVQERRGRYAEAMAQYQAILDREPGTVVAANNLAALIADHDATPERLQYALELSRELRTSINPIYLDTVGWVHYRLGDYDQAIRLLEQAVRSASDLPQLRAQLPQLRYHLGMAYTQVDRVEDARRELQAAVDASEGDFVGLDEARATLARL